MLAAALGYGTMNLLMAGVVLMIACIALVLGGGWALLNLYAIPAVVVIAMATAMLIIHRRLASGAAVRA